MWYARQIEIGATAGSYSITVDASTDQTGRGKYLDSDYQQGSLFARTASSSRVWAVPAAAT